MVIQKCHQKKLRGNNLNLMILQLKENNIQIHKEPYSISINNAFE